MAARVLMATPARQMAATAALVVIRALPVLGAPVAVLQQPVQLAWPLHPAATVATVATASARRLQARRAATAAPVVLAELSAMAASEAMAALAQLVLQVATA